MLSAWFLVPLAAPESPNSGPVSDPDAPGDSPYNPLPYGHPYPGLGPYQQPFQERVKIVYVEKPSASAAATSGYSAAAAAAPTVGYPAPTGHPIEEPKANCTLEEVKREEEICGPGKIDRTCETIEVKYMKITTEEQVQLVWACSCRICCSLKR